MKTASLLPGFGIFLLMSFALAGEDLPHYSRTDEIETRCSSYLSEAADLVSDDGSTLSSRLTNELSFSGGEWEQDNGSSPLMPFDRSDSWAWYPAVPEKLVDFDVIDVNPIQPVRNAVRLNGSLTIAIHRNRSHDSGIVFDAGFSMKPGFSTLVIVFDGVYVETGSEKVLCLLRNSKMPAMDRVDEPYYLQHNYQSIDGSLSSEIDSGGSDDRVLLVLRYPRRFSLTSRAIKGEMSSFDELGSSRYFDRVHVTSQLRNFSEYSFSEIDRSRVCNDSLFRDEMIENGAIEFDTIKVCAVLHEIQSIRLRVEPNYVGPEMVRLGPFVVNKKKIGSDQRHEDFELIFQSILCKVENGSIDMARVSAVVRAIPMKTDQVTATSRTGISTETMSVEGSWNNKLFCGIGCFEDRCDSQITFYFPRWLSVRQRNIVSGTISSIGHPIDTHYSPLHFRFLARPSLLMDYTMPCRYNYSKIDSARELWERRDRGFGFTTAIQKSVLAYPDMKHGYNRLSKQLSFRSYVLAVRPNYAGRFMVQAEVLSLGPLCGDNGDDIADSRFLNVSIHLKFIDEPHWHFFANYEVVTDMFFEGVYDDSLGEMHLLGCTGFDCSIEASLNYSPLNTRWLKHPIVTINVTSQRNVSDPLRFPQIMLQTYVIGPDPFEKDLLFRVIFEGLLRVLVLSMDIGIILSQFAYMNKNIDSVPQISVVMIGIQILGYVVPFLGGSEMAFPSKMSKSFKNHPHPQLWFDIMDHGTRFLLLVVILLMLMFFKRVKESRTRESTESEHITNDRKILLLTSAVHMTGFALFAAPKLLFKSKTGSPSWAIVLKKYFYVIQQIFLVPQIIAYYLSNKPAPSIRMTYIRWFLLSRCLLDFYDTSRDHVPYPISWEMNDMMEMLDRVEMVVPYKGDTVLSIVLIVVAFVAFVVYVRGRMARN